MKIKKAARCTLVWLAAFFIDTKHFFKHHTYWFGSILIRGKQWELLFRLRVGLFGKARRTK